MMRDVGSSSPTVSGGPQVAYLFLPKSCTMASNRVFSCPLVFCPQYLHRFKWTHLSERLAYERQVRQQRMRAEVSQAKRETNFYLQNVEKSKRFSQKSSPGEEGGKSWGFVQRRTEDEIQSSKGKKRLKQQQARAAEIEQKSQSNTSLLTKIFRVQQ